MATCRECNGTSKTGLCISCQINQMARNNYFTGKLLVERDFTDEQYYHMGKRRRHNRYLHGTGVACGFKVKQHPNPDCRDKYVVIEPGMAIDCCGREIFSEREQTLDIEAMFLTWWQEKNGPDTEPDDEPRHLGICVSYHECPTEEIPALFDDCGCDDMAVRPNRILETHQFSLKITAVPDPDEIPEEGELTEEQIAQIEEQIAQIDKELALVEDRLKQVEAAYHAYPEDPKIARELKELRQKQLQLLAKRQKLQTRLGQKGTNGDNQKGLTPEEIEELKEQLAKAEDKLAQVEAKIAEVEPAYEADPDNEELKALYESLLAERESLLAQIAELKAKLEGEMPPDDDGDGELDAPLEELIECLDCLFQDMLDGCPSCACKEEDCIPLAVIENYVYGDDMWDAEEQLPDEPEGDEEEGIAYINNDIRPLLPSTNTLLAIQECVLEYLQEQEERGIDDVTVELIDCDQPQTAEIQDTEDGRILHLTLHDSCLDSVGVTDVSLRFVDCDGNPVEDVPGSAAIEEGETGLILHLELPTACTMEGPPPPSEPLDLAQVSGLNWLHADWGEPTWSEEAGILQTADDGFINGLLIAFNGEVQAGTIHQQTFQVLVADVGDEFTCWCELRPAQGEVGAMVRGVQLALADGPNNTKQIQKIDDPLPPEDAFVNGARFVPAQSLRPDQIYRVVLKGDHVLGQTEDGKLSLDGNHIAPWLPNAPSGDGIPGGTFESWFTFRRPEPGGTPPPEEGKLNVNTATLAQLERVIGIGPEIARAIVAIRQRDGNYASLNQLIKVPGIGERKLTDISRYLTV